MSNVKTEFFDQPTNGITYVRIKANLKNLPEHLRLFVPMFADFFSSIGTKNYENSHFTNKVYGCTEGLTV